MGGKGEEAVGRMTLEFLEQTIDGSATSKEMRKAFHFEILWVDLNSILEDLERRGLVKLHRQSHSVSEPKYDKVVLLDAGRDFLKA